MPRDERRHDDKRNVSAFLTRRRANEVICPSCQFAAPQLYCPQPQISRIFRRNPHSSRGALRDRHERWARAAMDVKMRKANRIEADGEVVWS
jgi:hypothetical protein